MGTRTFVSRRPRRRQAVFLSGQRQGDVPLMLIVAALVVFGLLMLYSASWDFSLVFFQSPTYIFNRQLLWLALGVIVVFVFSRLDYHIWRKLAVPVMLVTILALIVVLIIGETRLGARRSILGGSVQPSELAKVVTVIYLAVWLYSKRNQLHDVQLGLIPLAIILGIVGGLIYRQPDLSAAGTVFILGGLLFFLAGGDLRQITLLLVATLIVGWLVVHSSPTGQERIRAFWEGVRDPTNASYHVQRSLEAIVKGGFFGVGIGRADTKLTGLPVPPTDSIFAVIAEELGLVGVLGLIALYGALLWRGLVIARRAPDMLGTLLAAGLSFWIGLEALINMSVMVGLMPFAGNALPFISAGGSNLLATLAAIGILLSISRHQGQGVIHEGLEDEWRDFGATVDLRRRNRRRRLSRHRRP